MSEKIDQKIQQAYSPLWLPFLASSLTKPQFPYSPRCTWGLPIPLSRETSVVATYNLIVTEEEVLVGQREMMAESQNVNG